ncbi:hypothetical protein D3C87_1733990 [compost metagenome]
MRAAQRAPDGHEGGFASMFRLEKRQRLAERVSAQPLLPESNCVGRWRSRLSGWRTSSTFKLTEQAEPGTLLPVKSVQQVTKNAITLPVENQMAER